jgi:hypothetical protein
MRYWVESFVVTLIVGLVLAGGYQLMKELSTVKTSVENILLDRSGFEHE